MITSLNNNLAAHYKVFNVVDVGAGILTTAGRIIGAADGKVSYVYLVTVTDSAGAYYCGIHFYRPNVSQHAVKLAGELNVATNIQGTISGRDGAAPYEYTVHLLSAK